MFEHVRKVSDITSLDYGNNLSLGESAAFVIA